MTDKTMHVWSPILTPTKTFKLGEAVTASDLGDDWDYLVEAGSVRPQPYPKHDNGDIVTQSPTNHVLEQIAAVADSGAYVADANSTRETPVITPVEPPK